MTSPAYPKSIPTVTPRCAERAAGRSARAGRAAYPSKLPIVVEAEAADPSPKKQRWVGGDCRPDGSVSTATGSVSDEGGAMR